MPDVFISHVEEDAVVAEAICDGLTAAGYQPWAYERNSLPGAPYISQVLNALRESSAVILILSQRAMGSLQVDKEVIQAYEGNKPFIPLLLGITHVDFRAHKPDWAMMLGTSTSVVVPPEGVEAIIPRMVEGLKVMGVHPSGSPSTMHTTTLSHPAPAAPATTIAATKAGPSKLPLLAGGGAAVLLLAAAGAFVATRGGGAAQPTPSASVAAPVQSRAPGALLTVVASVKPSAATVASTAPASIAPAASASSSAAPASSGVNLGPAAAKLLRTDDFTNPATGLFLNNQKGATRFAPAGSAAVETPWDYGYAGGALVLHIGTPSGALPSGALTGAMVAPAADKVDGDFAIEARSHATKSPAQAGLTMWFQATGGDTVSYAVQPNDQMYRLFGAKGGSYIRGRNTGLLPAPQDNTMRMEVRGDTVRLLLNGQQINRLQKPDFAQRPVTVGLGAEETGKPADGTLELQFHDFKVFSLT